ncbi:MAG: glycosyltransferase [Candidatus Omnitrophica bacterium]|nr:glycosyltransferase [Candidatus Omnitrophota bacterium]
MKIAVIVTEFPALSETFILEQLVGIVKAGHELEIFATTGAAQNKQHADIEKYNLNKHIYYFPPISKNKLNRICKAFWLGLINFHKDPLLIIKAFNLKRYRTCRQIYTVIPFLNKKFDIIHCHFGPNGIIGADLKLLGVRGKLLTSFHGYDVNNYPRTYGNDVYRTLFSAGDFFTANTNFTKQQALLLGAQEDKIEIIHEGFNTDKFKFSRKELLLNQSVNLLSVGRLVEKKGHKYALIALAMVYKKFKNINYTIAGEGPLRPDLEAQADLLGINKIVKFVGNVDQAQVAKLYEQAHIFILPSITTRNFDREGQALVLQEAQACGLPVLATLHNGIPEGVIDGKTAFLVKEKDVYGLAEKLEYLVSNPQIWQKMGQAGREFVEQKFSSEVLNQQLFELYGRIIEDC